MNKVRVQLLDNKTGSVLEEVDVLTSAEAVTFADGETFQQKLDNGKLKGNTGSTGAKGADGLTPTIGANGNWYIGSTDTGKPARGTKGDTGSAGQNGQNGKDGYTPIKGKDYFDGAKGEKGDPGRDGDSVKFGTTYATASDVKVFFKKI